MCRCFPELIPVLVTNLQLLGAIAREEIMKIGVIHSFELYLLQIAWYGPVDYLENLEEAISLIQDNNDQLSFLNQNLTIFNAVITMQDILKLNREGEKQTNQ